MCPSFPWCPKHVLILSIGLLGVCVCVCVCATKAIILDPWSPWEFRPVFRAFIWYLYGIIKIEGLLLSMNENIYNKCTKGTLFVLFCIPYKTYAL